MNKIMIYILIAILSISTLTGCSGKKTDNDIEINDSQLGQVEDKEDEELNQKEINLDLFFNLQESIVKNDLKIKKDYEGTYPYVNVEGEYDLNGDGKEDTIEIKLVGGEESVVKVNDQKMILDLTTPWNFHLVDLIKDDGFIELAIYDDGPSVDPETTFLRYDGKQLYKLGSFPNEIDIEDSIYSYSGNILTDGKGNFIPSDSIAKFICPNIIMGYYSLENQEFIYYPVDYSDCLGKEYSVVEDLETFFIEEDISKNLTSQDIDFRWDFKNIMNFKKGDKIKIITHSDFWYGVELTDGATGILYFWIGD